MLDHRGPAVGGEGAFRALQLPFDEVGADAPDCMGEGGGGDGDGGGGNGDSDGGGGEGGGETASNGGGGDGDGGGGEGDAGVPPQLGISLLVVELELPG